MKVLKQGYQNPVNRIRYEGTSAILTIDPLHVRRLKIDSLTFFEEIPVDNGILLEMRKLESAERRNMK
jgi:hypothetical protein